MMTGLKKTVMLANQSSGESIVWNQLISGAQNAVLLENGNYKNTKSSTLIRMLVNGSVSSDLYKGHKILRRAGFKVIDKGDFALLQAYFFSTSTFINKSVVEDGNISLINITTCNTTANLCYWRGKTESGGYPTSGTFEFNFWAHDLTLMFGAGNEPTSFDEFIERINPYMSQIGNINDYNEGETISI